MSEKPILCTGEDVRALLDGRKTVTRRVVKFPDDWEPLEYQGVHAWGGDPKIFHSWMFDTICGRYSGQIKCPYGASGDELWVRETILRPTGSCLMEWGEYESYGAGGPVEYCADGANPRYRDKSQNVYMRKVPSIHTYRSESRIQLRITGVRVERVQEISEDDAIEEGIQEYYGIISANCNGGQHNEVHGYRYDFSSGGDFEHEDSISAFEELWDSINGKTKSESWNANPFVWVIEFEVVK